MFSISTRNKQQLTFIEHSVKIHDRIQMLKIAAEQDNNEIFSMKMEINQWIALHVLNFE